MEFDKSRVYTALNADELKVGSRVIVADTLSGLKQAVEEETIRTLKSVSGENYGCRFLASNGVGYFLAYLVSEPEPKEKKLKWTDLKIGDVIRSKTYDREYMVIGIDRHSNNDHICTSLIWITDEALADEWEKVENE